jgi:hypothetical protein
VVPITGRNAKRVLFGAIEPSRICRRPYLLRGWGHDEEDLEPVFA